MSSPDEADVRPCPVCGGTLKLAHVLPKIGGLPELRSYHCVNCGEVETVEDDGRKRANLENPVGTTLLSRSLPGDESGAVTASAER